MSQENLTVSDPGRPFVIRRRDGSEWTVLVSECDFERVMSSEVAWTLRPPGGFHRTAYVRRSLQVGGGRRRTQFLHRFVLNLSDSSTSVDHINHNGLDNRRSNLRLASPEENSRNGLIRRDNRSGYRGVCFDSTARKWLAQISVSNRRIYLGHFDTPEAAHEAYKAAAVRLHKEFARF